jgi:hypothetical protein
MAVTINGTTGIAGVDGSASTPAVQGTDTNTGIFFPAADTIAFGEGGAESMRIDSSGNVGIGTSSPSQKLDVTGNARLNASSSPVLQLSESGTLRGSITGSSTIGLYFQTFSSTPISFDTNGLERARITSGGDFVLGATTNSGYNFRVSAGNKYAAGFENSSGNIPITCQIVSGSGSQTFITFYNGATNTGYINTTGTNTLYTSISDYRLKENIQPMTNALTAVAQLRPCTYTWKADGSDGQGFIAHELQAVVPDCVTGEKDAVDADGNPKYQGIDTSFLVATLTAAIQELKAELDTTKARLAALENK